MRTSLEFRIIFAVLILLAVALAWVMVPMQAKYPDVSAFLIPFMMYLGFALAGLGVGTVTVCPALRRLLFQRRFARFLGQKGFLVEPSHLIGEIVRAAGVLLLIVAVFTLLVFVWVGFGFPAVYRMRLPFAFIGGILCVAIGRSKGYRKDENNVARFLHEHKAAINQDVLQARTEEIRGFLDKEG